MKTHISPSQLKEIPEERKQKLKGLCKPQEGEWVFDSRPSDGKGFVFANYDYQPYCYLIERSLVVTKWEPYLYPLPSNNKMIKILIDAGWRLSITMTDGGYFWVKNDLPNGMSYCYPCLCKALWQAVKNILKEVPEC